jgi:hypothetical protein
MSSVESFCVAYANTRGFSIQLETKRLIMLSLYASLGAVDVHRAGSVRGEQVRWQRFAGRLLPGEIIAKRRVAVAVLA